MELNRILTGNALDVLKTLPDNLVHACITSPPYYSLRSYGLTPIPWPEVIYSPMAGLPPVTIPAMDADLGLEPDPWAFIGHLVAIFREVRRTLRDDGCCWINMGDSYATSANGRSAADTKAAGNDDRTFRDKPFSTVGNGLKPKDLMLMPHRVAMALQADGWYLRSDIPWIKRNPMPGSQQDRPTTSKEYWFLMAKSERYYFDIEAIRRPLAESTGPRMQRAVSDNHKNSNGAPGQTPHTLAKSRPNTNGARAPDLLQTRSPRESDWFFDSLRSILNGGQFLLTDEACEPLALPINPKGYKQAHFATFPETLIEPMVKASPERVCAECGSPWVRVVERSGGDWQTRKARGEAARHGLNSASACKSGDYSGSKITTIDWQKSCQCTTDATKPGLLLDPFGGSGTTAKVAIKHNRDWLLIELNQQYAQELVTDRIDGTQRRLL